MKTLITFWENHTAELFRKGKDDHASMYKLRVDIGVHYACDKWSSMRREMSPSSLP